MPSKSEIHSDDVMRQIYGRADAGLPFEKWLLLRDKCRKDLWFLFDKVLKKSLAEQPQKELCEFFVHKNFDGVYVEGYTLKHVHDAIALQDSCRERMLLAPRGGTKSTVDCVDCVQWIINCPDIRIFIETGEYSLARKFLREVKSYFYKPADAAATDFQQLFPEYIIHALDDQPLRCPARTERFKSEDFTIWCNSLTASNAGWHCDIRKCDDVVTEQNSNTPEARAKLKDTYDNHANLIDEWGFDEAIGTRYAPDDLYGVRLALLETDPDILLKYRRYRCWEVLPEFANVPLKSLEEHMVKLWFPAKLDWKSLRKKLRKNETTFRCQQLNEPAGADELVHFELGELQAHECQSTKVPGKGDIYILTDTALTVSSYADYSAFAVVKICERTAYVLEIVYGKWKQSDLALRVVELQMKWNPKIFLIEESNGYQGLREEIRRQATRKNVSTNNIYWKKPKRELDGKKNRIKGLQILLADDRLYFVIGPWLDETFRQLTKYTGERKKRGKDDIPDCLSYMAEFIPAEKKADDAPPVAASNEDKKAQMLEQWASMQAEAGRFFTVVAAPQPENVIAETPKPRSGASRFFGGNGLRA